MSLLRDGFSTTITPTLGAFGLVVVEKTVTPMGMEMGGPIGITSMRNVAFRTQIAKSLISCKPFNLTVQWDPAWGYNTLLSTYLGVNQQLRITFPDGSGVIFYGWYESLDPMEHKEGDEPLATLQICPSNLNGSLVEQGPVYAAP